MIELHYTHGVLGGKCCECGTDEDVIIDEDGDFICTDCLFELQCEGEWPEDDGEYMEY